MAKPAVLVVEDDFFIAHGLAGAFQDAGFRVVGPFADADAALRAARTTPPRLAVMDVRINGPRDGIEAARELRAICDCPILFHTAHADPDTVDRLRAMPRSELLRKPATAAALLDAARAALADAPSQEPERADATPLVLVVEDNDLVRETVVHMVERAGCRVLQARDGLEAVALFAGGKVDLVFCDLLMPRRSGLEALRTFKQLAPGIPVVVITGATSREADGRPPELAAMAAGAAEVLRKPFRAADVRGALGRWLPRREIGVRP